MEQTPDGQIRVVVRARLERDDKKSRIIKTTNLLLSPLNHVWRPQSFLNMFAF